MIPKVRQRTVSELAEGGEGPAYEKFEISCSNCGRELGYQSTLIEALAFAKGLIYPRPGSILPDGLIPAIVELNVKDIEFDGYNYDHGACMNAFAEGLEHPYRDKPCPHL